MDNLRRLTRSLTVLTCLLVAQEVEATFGLHVKNVGVDTITFVVGRRASPYTGPWQVILNTTLDPGEENHLGYNSTTEYQYQFGDNATTPNAVWQDPFIVPAYTSTLNVIEVNGEAEPEELYYEACQQNPGDTPARAVWKKNGAIVFQVVINPGEERCYTFTYFDTDTIQYGIEGIQYLIDDDGGLIIATDDGLIDGNPLDGTNDPENPFTIDNEGNLPPRNPYADSTDPRIGNVITWDPGDDSDEIAKKGFGALLSTGQAYDEALLEEAVRIRKATEFMTNQVSNLPDPDSGEVHNDQGQVTTAAESAFDLIGATAEDLSTGIEIPGGAVGSQSLPTSIMLANGMTFNANPLGNSTVAGMASAMRTLSTWLVALIVSLVLLKSIQESFNSVIQVPQGTTVGQSFAGFNAALPSALVVAAIIIVVIAGALVVLVGYFTSLFPTFDPIAQFSASGTVQAAAMYWADSIFDMRAALAGIVAIVVGKILIMVTTGLQGSVIRLLTGA